MGLDLYAVRSPEVGLTEEDGRAFMEAGIELCEFNGEAGSFRGKMYDTLLINVTGMGPYQHWIPPEVVRKMWLALMDCDPEILLEKDREICEDNGQEYRGSSLEELTADILELRKFFKVCAERNFGLVGKW